MSRAQPWMKFYPADWRADPALRMCSLAARGLWVEMLSIMHEAEPYGYLLVNGRPVTDAQLAVLAAAPSDQVPSLLDELETAGVFSRTRKGVIFSRRMVRDEKKSEEGRKSVEKRWKKAISSEVEASENKEEFPPPNREPNRNPITKKPEARSQIPEDIPPTSSLRSDVAPPPDQSGIGADEAQLSDLPLAVPAEAPDVARQAFDAWNDLARDIGLPIAQVFTARRQSALKARLAEVGGLDGWGVALAKIRGSPFLRGETSRDGWKADLDFLLQQKSFTKLMEGSYDRSASRKPPTNSQQAAHEARSAAFRRVADQFRRDDDLP